MILTIYKTFLHGPRSQFLLAFASKLPSIIAATWMVSQSYGSRAGARSRHASQARSSNQQSPPCRGPHENYVDRCDSAHPRLYTSAVPALHTPYIAPAENGGREGARWLALCPEVWAPMPCLLPVLLLHC